MTAEMTSLVDDVMESDFDKHHNQEYKTHFKKAPMINVIGKEAYEQRTAEVFEQLWLALSRSFGPYGANTTILNYPFHHVTKDGFTIMKNLSLNTADTLVDQSIANLASDICGRLNYSVGDGTTTAVIATNGIYQKYMEERENLKSLMIMPRDVSDFYKKIIPEITADLEAESQQVESSDPEKLYKNIYDVVYISSNGNKELSEYIAGFYKELHCPAITVEMAPDGVTSAQLITGYSFKARLTDAIYCNSDERKLNLSEADVLIFTVKINTTLYEKIIKPLNEASRQRGRRLICLAPNYDKVLLDNTVSPELNDEYRSSKSVNLVLMTYSSAGASDRRIIEDFAVLCDTVTFDQSRCTQVLKLMEEGKTLEEIFNMDNRLNIPHLMIGVAGTAKIQNSQAKTLYAKMTVKDYQALLDPTNEAHNDSLMVYTTVFHGENKSRFRVGYVCDMSLGLKSSVFHKFFYDENRYDAQLMDAKNHLDEVTEKYIKLGTFNTDVSNAQSRYYALGLKIGTIQVGGDSELSRGYFKDVVDDAVRAAASAYNHGIVLGCNTSLLKVLYRRWNNAVRLNEVAENGGDTVMRANVSLINILLEGFMEVYRTLIGNMFEDVTICNGCDVIELKDMDIMVREYCERYAPYIPCGNTWFSEALEMNFKKYGTKVTIHNLIIFYSIASGKVFDLTKKKFVTRVINSTWTDVEVLRATSDLITMLIVSNQMVVTQKRNFDIVN